MNEQKTDRKSRYTRKVLRDSLIELLEQKPIGKITIKELCENADLNRTTFYAHYRDQYDLLRQTEEETLAFFEDMLDKYDNRRSRPEVTEMLGEMLTFIANNSNSIQVLLSENGDINFQKKLFRYFINNKQITKYFHEKMTDSKTKEYYSVFMINGTLGLIQHWLKNNMTITIPHLVRMILKMTQQA
jgi:AcrR family transcriptional regulator